MRTWPFCPCPSRGHDSGRATSVIMPTTTHAHSRARVHAAAQELRTPQTRPDACREAAACDKAGGLGRVGCRLKSLAVCAGGGNVGFPWLAPPAYYARICCGTGGAQPPNTRAGRLHTHDTSSTARHHIKGEVHQAHRASGVHVHTPMCGYVWPCPDNVPSVA